LWLFVGLALAISVPDRGGGLSSVAVKRGRTKTA
jgi:hypothetical protein